jgi:biopolymer transport protein TolR
VTKRRHSTLGHSSARKLDEVRNDINVTPLVDVCLVLLIIFMVVSPMLTRGKEVSLPKTKNYVEKKDSGQQPIVSVTKDGRFYFDQDGFANSDLLRERIEKELKRNAGATIFLKADESLTWAQVYPAVIAIHEAGSSGIELGTAEIKEK